MLEHRNAIWQERTGLGDGPGDPDRGDTGADASERNAGSLSGRHAPGKAEHLGKAFLAQPWEKARESVEVKLLAQGDELYILAKSTGRMHKERAMRQRRLKRLWKRLHELQRQKLTRDHWLGAAKKTPVIEVVESLTVKQSGAMPKSVAENPKHWRESEAAG